VEEDAASIDLFIGEADHLHRGLGAPSSANPATDRLGNHRRQFVVMGPAANNWIAIRAYEKAGFRHGTTVLVPGEPEPEYLMRLVR
jgi:predicted GNAT family acetyltransferase